MDTTSIILAVVGTLVVLFFGLAGVLYMTRGNPVSSVRALGEDADPDVSGDRFCREIESHVDTSIESGNEVEVLYDAEVCERLFADLAQARDLVTWHVFWYKPGGMADRLKEILIERARSGVDVLLLYDRFGSGDMPDAYWDELRDAGVDVHIFRPLTISTLYKWQKRSHIRTVIIDGRIGYTGGFCIHDDWWGENPVRDTSARFRGPAVLQLQSAFAADWAEATGELLVGERAFPDAPRELEGDHVAGLVSGMPSIGSTKIERYHALSIAAARERLYITNAYFVPDDDFRRFLVEAVERGVDVRVLMSTKENIDSDSTYHAGRHHFEELLRGGVRIFEFGPNMVHAKTLTVDGIWSGVGSANFDNRSMSLNDEVVLMVYAQDVAKRLEDRFLADLERATELDLETFLARGVVERFKERFYVFFSRIL
ncbi:MAG TPA: phospholipase D-like domain-containing protein [Longimicrobiales bacterium]|nr:phospholipase D-like domain-containing protein [Longimicrobiales bacterium]